MDEKTLIVAVLSSSFLAAVVTSMATGLFSLRLKKKEFLYEYHKKILEKRVAAYESIESLIAVLKGSVLDEDGKACHIVFWFGFERYAEHLIQIQGCMAQSLWLSEEVIKQINQLNYIYLNATNENVDLVDFGKENYVRVAEARDELEKAFARDIGQLHDFDTFIRGKSSKKTGFTLVNVKKG